MRAAGASALAVNVLQFARLLRSAGLPVGVGRALAAAEAAACVGPERRDDLHAALAATLIDRAEQRPLFDAAFGLFWRARPLAQPGLPVAAKKSPGTQRADETKLPPGRRAGNRGTAPSLASMGTATPHEAIALDAALTWSAREVLRNRDFEAMSAEELERARRVLRTLRLPLPHRLTRRHVPHPAGGRLDLRATLRQNLRFGGEWLLRRHRVRREAPRDLVVLCDISGSMERYARMLLHFLHALGQTRPGVHIFVFGTRLTNITRMLRSRDVDRALAAVSRAVPDWSGGTRIGACLHEFNRRWSRRVLGRGAVVLLISDGLDAAAGADLDAEMRRLRASCALLLWLNPLLRFRGFEPRAAGIRTMLPYVDYFLPAHDLASLEDLGRVFRDWRPADTHPIFEKRRPHDGNDRRAANSRIAGQDLAGAERSGGAEGLHSRLRID